MCALCVLHPGIYELWPMSSSVIDFSGKKTGVDFVSLKGMITTQGLSHGPVSPALPVRFFTTEIPGKPIEANIFD